MRGRVSAVWATLRQDAPDSVPGWFARLLEPESGVRALAALRIPDLRPAVLLEVPAASVPAVREYPSAHGFELYPETVIPGPSGVVRLCLLVSDGVYTEMFSVLAEDVAERLVAAASAEQAVRILLARLVAWQTFLRRRQAELTPDEVKGLLAELLFLKDLISHLSSAIDAVRAWKGPDRGLHDFVVGDGVAIEVKASGSRTGSGFTVANLEQLDDEGLDSLLVCHTALPSHAEGAALPELISTLRDFLVEEPPPWKNSSSGF